MYIKRFESIEIDHDLEYCKDIIDTLDEYEDGVEATHYRTGYYDRGYGDLEKNSRGEKSKLAASFYLKLTDFDGDIREKSDFDKAVSLIHRAKSLYAKFDQYCDDVIIEIKDGSVKFILLFEHKDESEKSQSRRKRIIQNLYKHFEDFKSVKTFWLKGENKDQYLPILKQIEKAGNFKYYEKDIGNPATAILANENSYSNIEFRFAISINSDNDIITVAPSTLKWKSYNIEKWQKLKSTPEIMDCISNNVKDRLVQSYRLNNEDISKSKVYIEDGIIKIKVS